MAAVPTGSAWAAGPVAFAQLWPGPSSCVDLTPGPRQPGASPTHVMHSQRDAWPRQPPPPRAPRTLLPAPPPPRPRCRHIPRGFIPILGYPECVRGLGAHGRFYLITPKFVSQPPISPDGSLLTAGSLLGCCCGGSSRFGVSSRSGCGGVDFLTWKRENGGGREWECSGA